MVEIIQSMFSEHKDITLQILKNIILFQKISRKNLKCLKIKQHTSKESIVRKEITQ